MIFTDQPLEPENIRPVIDEQVWPAQQLLIEDPADQRARAYALFSFA